MFIKFKDLNKFFDKLNPNVKVWGLITLEQWRKEIVSVGVPEATGSILNSENIQYATAEYYTEGLNPIYGLNRNEKEFDRIKELKEMNKFHCYYRRSLNPLEIRMKMVCDRYRVDCGNIGFPKENPYALYNDNLHDNQKIHDLFNNSHYDYKDGLYDDCIVDIWFDGLSKLLQPTLLFFGGYMNQDIPNEKETNDFIKHVNKNTKIKGEC